LREVPHGGSAPVDFGAIEFLNFLNGSC